MDNQSMGAISSPRLPAAGIVLAALVLMAIIFRPVRLIPTGNVGVLTGILIESVLLRDVRPPETLRAAIEAKQSAEQEALRMQFVLQKETQEAERKRIEAEGIAAFQKIVTQGISEPLLQWKGIEATEKLAQSQNTKVIVVGAGKSGLPLILGQ